jgi:cell division protein FtsB
MEHLQTVFNIVFGLLAGTLGWFARELWAAVKELKSDLAKLREELPKTYVLREDYRADIREVKDMLGKIFDRLDTKADKP